MASGAGLNRIGGSGGVVILTVNPSSTPNTLATYLGAYGNAGNDSGVVLVEGTGFTKLNFQLVAAPGQVTTPSGYSVQILYTIDSRAYGQWEASINPMKYWGVTGGPPVVPASSWLPMPALSDQTGTGVDSNPITITNGLAGSRSVVAIRAVLVGASTPSGTAQVIGQLVP